MRRISASFMLILLGLGACNSPAPPPPKGYYGPTLSLEDLVGKINENNAKIPTLWSREHFYGTLVDREHNKSGRMDGYGNLLYTGPNKLKMTAKNEVTDLFEMGSDGEKYWFYDKHDSQFWWGDFADAGSVDSGEVPVRPDMVMEILGIRPINPFLTQAPIPTVRFNNGGDFYMIDWMAPSAGHWVVVKEIWYDRVTYLPRKVLIFDGLGCAAVVAWLKNYQPVEVEGLDRAHWPKMATQFDLSFTYGGTMMTFELTDMSLTKYGRPSDATYHMPDPADLGGRGVKVTRIGEGESH